MRKSLAFLVLSIVAAASVVPGAAQSPRDAMLKSVHQFVEGFNTGDIKSAVAACANDIAIIDEFAPFEWHGPGAMTKWLNDYATDAKKKGLTDGKVTLGTLRTVMVEGRRGYVVGVADYSYKLKGKPVKQTGATFTFALRKDAARWHIVGWVWSQNNRA